MQDLRGELTETWRVATQAPQTNGARAIMFMSARTGEGTSSVAASFAMLAASRARRGVWLIDLDLMQNLQYAAFENGPFTRVLGRAGRPHNADLGAASFYSVTPPSAESRKSGANPGMMVVHRVGNSKLLVSRFRKERLEANQQVRIKTGADYWKAVRGIADWIIVDAPALEESSAGLAVCSQMDATALVVRADRTAAQDVSRLGQEIEGHGGTCLGMVLNDMRSDARMVDQLVG